MNFNWNRMPMIQRPEAMLNSTLAIFARKRTTKTRLIRGTARIEGLPSVFDGQTGQHIGSIQTIRQ